MAFGMGHLSGEMLYACRWDHSQKMYSDDAEFWHPLFIVKGRDNIFGAHMFWSFINRKTNARVKRIGRLLCCLLIV